MVKAAETPDHSRLTIHDSRLNGRRACVLLAVGSTVWSLVILVTGGIALPLVSSRNPRNPAIVAGGGLSWALLLRPGGGPPGPVLPGPRRGGGRRPPPGGGPSESRA